MKIMLLLLAIIPVTLGTFVKEMMEGGHYQGDMILTDEQKMEEKFGKIGFGSTTYNKWPKSRDGKVYIPYEMQSAISSSSLAMKAIQAAFADYSKYTCIRFTPRRRNEQNYIYLYQGKGCSSYVGMIGRRQTVNLASGCWGKATVIHELGHAIGFKHEQSRPDRDNYLKIHWENIPADKKHNFNIGRSVNSLGTPYDYRSVMHYDKTAFGKGKLTMEAKNPYYYDLIGNGSGFSDMDVKQINLLYQCPVYRGASPDPRPQTPSCHDTTSYCEMYINKYGGCQKWLHKYCPHFCKVC